MSRMEMIFLFYFYCHWSDTYKTIFEIFKFLRLIKCYYFINIIWYFNQKQNMSIEKYKICFQNLFKIKAFHSEEWRFSCTCCGKKTKHGVKFRHPTHNLPKICKLQKERGILLRGSMLYARYSVKHLFHNINYIKLNKAIYNNIFLI